MSSNATPSAPTGHAELGGLPRQLGVRSRGDCAHPPRVSTSTNGTAADGQRTFRTPLVVAQCAVDARLLARAGTCEMPSATDWAVGGVAVGRYC
jgi:hypothetical protein